MMALVFGVMAASILAGSMHLVLGSQSTNTAVAPAIQMASAVAKKVLGGDDLVAGPMPRAISASQMASVPLPTPMACFVPQKAASSFSNCLSIGPMTYSPLSSTFLMLASISAFRRRGCCGTSPPRRRRG
jgi:hypothetical protein